MLDAVASDRNCTGVLAAVKRLIQKVQVMLDILTEFREELQWPVHNGEADEIAAALKY